MRLAYSAISVPVSGPTQPRPSPARFDHGGGGLVWSGNAFQRSLNSALASTLRISRR